MADAAAHVAELGKIYAYNVAAARVAAGCGAPRTAAHYFRQAIVQVERMSYIAATYSPDAAWHWQEVRNALYADIAALAACPTRTAQ